MSAAAWVFGLLFGILTWFALAAVIATVHDLLMLAGVL